VTELRLATSSCVRLVADNDKDQLVLSHHMNNPKVYNSKEASQALTFPLFAGPALEFVIESFPHFFRVCDLPLSDQERVEVASVLFEEGILLPK